MLNEVDTDYVTTTSRSFPNSFIQKIRALQPLETPETMHELTSCNIPREFNLQPQCCENLKSHLPSVQLL